MKKGWESIKADYNIASCLKCEKKLWMCNGPNRISEATRYRGIINVMYSTWVLNKSRPLSSQITLFVLTWRLLQIGCKVRPEVSTTVRGDLKRHVQCWTSFWNEWHCDIFASYCYFFSSGLIALLSAGLLIKMWSVSSFQKNISFLRLKANILFSISRLKVNPQMHYPSEFLYSIWCVNCLIKCFVPFCRRKTKGYGDRGCLTEWQMDMKHSL